MVAMNASTYQEQAEDCRRKALAYLGKPEAQFLLRVAREFEDLSRDQNQRWRRRS